MDLLRRTLLLSVVLLAAPAHANDNRLVGTWISVEEEEVEVTFSGDGSLSIRTKAGTQDGSWLAEGDQLQLAIAPPGGSETLGVTCRYLLEGDRLTVKPGDQKCGENSFERSK